MSQNSNRGIKVFLYSSILFLLIACLVAGFSYALFTDEVKVENVFNISDFCIADCCNL